MNKKQLNPIIDFSAVPPCWRTAAFKLFEEHRMSITPLSNSNTFQYVFQGEGLNNPLKLSYFKLLVPNLTNMGVKIIDSNQPVQSFRNRQFISFEEQPQNAVDFQLINVPPQNRAQIIQIFQEENIPLEPVKTEKNENAPFLYRMPKEFLKQFWQNERLQRIVRENEIQYTLPATRLPTLKESLPKAVVKKRKAIREQIEEAKASYYYQKEMEKMKPNLLQKLKNMACAGISAAVFSAALNPNGTSAFINTLTEGRIDKIVTNAVTELNAFGKTVQKSLINPKEAAARTADKTAHFIQVNARRFQNKTPVKIGEEILLKGILNIGSVTFNTGAHVVNQLWGIRELWENNSEKFTEVGDLSYQAYARNPLRYINTAFVSVDKKTGLKENDTIFTIIDEGRTEAAKAFIQKGLLYEDELYQGNYGLTPLRYAIEKNQPQIAQMIWDKQQNYSYKETPDGKTAFMRAIEMNALSETEALNGEMHEDERSSENVQKYKEMQVLIMKMAKSRLINVHAACADGKDVVSLAVACGNSEVLPVLIQRGADIHKKTYTGDRDLMHLAGNNPRMIRLLFYYNVRSDELNANQNTPFMEVLNYSDEHPGQNDKAITAFLEYFSPEMRKELSMAPFYAYYIEKWAERNNQAALTLLPLPQQEEQSKTFNTLTKILTVRPEIQLIISNKMKQENQLLKFGNLFRIRMKEFQK